MKAAKVGDVRMVKRLVVRAGARLDLTDKVCDIQLFCTLAVSE